MEFQNYRSIQLFSYAVLALIFLSFTSFSVSGSSLPAAQSIDENALNKESIESLSSADFAKWKRGINLGRKMMCQIDHRNCGSFNEAKRFGVLDTRMNPNLISDMLKNALIQTAMEIQEK